MQEFCHKLTTKQVGFGAGFAKSLETHYFGGNLYYWVNLCTDLINNILFVAYCAVVCSVDCLPAEFGAVSSFISIPYLPSYESIYKHIGKHQFRWLLWFGSVSNRSQYIPMVYTNGNKAAWHAFWGHKHTRSLARSAGTTRRHTKKTISQHAFLQ